MTRGRKRRLFIAATALASLCLFAVGLVGALLFAVVFTETGTRVALRTAARAYSDMIPGSISVGTVSGTLGFGLTLESVSVKDRNDAPLVEAGTIHLLVDINALFAPRLDVPVLALENATVHLREGEGAGFADLAPPEDTAPVASDTPFSLPFAMGGNVRVRDFRLVVVSASKGEAQPVAVSDFLLRIDARERWAKTTLYRAEGRADALGEGTGQLTFVGTWHKAVVSISDFRFRHPVGTVDIPTLRYDFSKDSGNIEAFAVAHKAALASLAKVTVAKDPTLYLKASGGPEKVSATVRVSADGNSHLTARIKGALFPAPDFDARFEVTGMPEQMAPVAERRLKGKGALTVVGADYPSATVDGAFRCEGCELPLLGPFDLDLDAELKEGDGTVQASVAALGAVLKGNATLESLWPKQVDVEATLEDISTLSPLMAPEMLGNAVGAVSVSGRCSGPEAAFRCEADIAARGLRTPYGRIRDVSGTVRGAPLLAALPYDGVVRLKGVRVKGERIGAVHLDFKGDKHRVEATVSALRYGRERLRLAFAVAFSPSLRIDVATLQASYKGLDTRLNRPFSVGISDARIAVDGVDLTVADGAILLNGVFDRNGASDIAATIKRLDLGRLGLLLPGLNPKGRVDGSVTLEGEPDRFRSAISVTASGLSVEGVPFGALKLTADYRPGLVSGWFESKGGIGRRVNAGFSFGAMVNLKTMAARLGDGDIYLDGQVDAFALDGLTRFVPELELEGVASAEVSIRGTLETPRFRFGGAVDGLAWRGIAVGDVSFKASYKKQRGRIAVDLAGPAARSVHLEAVVPAAWVDHRPLWRLSEPHRLVLNIDGGQLWVVSAVRAALGDETVTEAPLGGTVDVVAEVGGDLSNPIVDLYLETDTLEWRSRPFGYTSLRVKVADHLLDLHAQTKKSQNQYADLKARIPFILTAKPLHIGPYLDGDHFIDFRFAGMQKELVALVADLPDPLDFRVSGTMTGAGRYGDFSLQGAFRGDVAFGRYGPHRVRGEIDADPDAQVATLSVGPKASPFVKVGVQTALPGRLDTTPEALIASLPVKGRLEIPHLTLSRFSGYLPTALHKLEGVLKGTVDIGGTVTAPTVSGALNLSGGAVTIAPLNQRIRDIAMDISVTEKRLWVENITFSSGRGRGNGRSALSLSDDGVVGEGLVRFQKFPFVRPGFPGGLINGELHADVLFAKSSTEIGLKILKTNVHLMNTSGATPPKDIRSGERIVYVDSEADGGTSKPKDDAPSTPPVYLTIDMTDPVEIRGQGVEMVWGGAVSVTSKGGENRVKGSIEAKPGRLRMIGNIFDIESGSITFPPSGKLDPFVNIVATVRTPEATVTATVRGRIAKPDLELTSDPAMTQYQIVALLVTGKSDTAAESDEEGDVAVQAASLLLSFNNPGLERQLYEKLGVDRIAVSVGSSVAEPIVVVGKRLGRRVYVESEYHHNAPEDENRATGRIEYRIAPGWTLETEYGDAQKGEVGVFWQKRFGGEKTAGDLAVEKKETAE